MKSCLKNPICFSFLEIIGANFSEARVRRNSSPQPPPSAAPERSGQEFFSKWVRATFRISHQLSFSPYFAILCAHGKRRQNGEKTASNPRQRMGGFEQPAHLDLFHPFSHLTRLLLPLKPKCAE